MQCPALNVPGQSGESKRAPGSTEDVQGAINAKRGLNTDQRGTMRVAQIWGAARQQLASWTGGKNGGKRRKPGNPPGRRTRG